MTTFEYQAEIEYIQARHGVDDIRAMEIHAKAEAAMNRLELQYELETYPNEENEDE